MWSTITVIITLFAIIHTGPADAWKLSISNKALKAASSVAVGIGLMGSTLDPAYALGPVNMKLAVKSYKQVELCNGQKPIMPGQKAMEGLFPVCIEVEAELQNPDAKGALSDVSVYGFVKEDTAGNSVLPNNPDFRSDSGQYAMIKTVQPGDSTVKYQFVAAVSVDPKKEELPKLSFLKTKATSFPGGSKFQPLSECEMDPRNCEDGDGDED
jgi:hypothetical protein